MANTPARMEYQQFTQTAPTVYAALAALSKAVTDSGLDKALVELVKLRVSQINGCAFCLQFHLNIIRKLDVDPRKLDLLAAWREAGVFSDREQAALAWAEALTNLSGHGADDVVYARVREHYSEQELAFLSTAVASINFWNRVAVGYRFTPPPADQGVAR